MHANETVTLQSPGGERAVISLFGGQVLSWTDPEGMERLYLSPWPSQPGRPIRGGVPVCFPQFASRGPLVKHGFARTSQWSVLASPGENSAHLRLADDAQTRSVWPHRFQLDLLVSLEPATLQLQLQVTNTDVAPWSFSTALHTYLRMMDVNHVTLEGLGGSSFEDALRDGRLANPDQSGPDLRSPIDRVYRAVPGPLVMRERSRALMTIAQNGFEDVVVWNPGREGAAKLDDMPGEDAARMLCVEAARIAQPVVLEPAHSWTGVQRLQLL